MAGDLPEWKARVVDYVGLGFLLVFTEEIFRSPKDWHWVAALVFGIAFLWSGDAVPIIWKKISTHRRRPEGSLAAQENSKPQHNVKFVGLKLIKDELYTAAALTFQNVPNGNLLGKFEQPRLTVVYYECSTGEELYDFYALHWYDDGGGRTDISLTGRSAVVAMFTDKWMVGGEDEPPPSPQFFEDRYIGWNGYRSIVLPFGEIRIIASLFGNNVDSPVLAVSGVMTLGTDGSASFSQDV